jgi:hypothetical protein
MTNEEAIKAMTKYMPKDNDSVSLVLREAMNMGIKVLEQEPCDCISRQGAIDALGYNISITSDEGLDEYRPVLKEMLEKIYDTQVAKIKALPSVQQKPMQVELEGDGYSDGQLVYDYGKCPKCGWQFEYGEKDWEEPYCCHCGQKLHWFESEDKE